MSSQKIRPVVLSGGSGTRLWPASRAEHPKQFLSLTDSLSMLQLTLQRVPGSEGFTPPLIVASRAHRSQLQGQLNEVEPEAIVILEPASRNTAPAIALAALSVEPDDLVLVMPSDHIIGDLIGFRLAVEAARSAAEQGHLVTFGIRPDQPETGYGYIKAGASFVGAAHAVERFVEKPDLATANQYLSEGGYFWNGGIFMFRARDFILALEEFAPDVLAASRLALERGVSDGNYLLPDSLAFERSPSISVDYAVMEKAENVCVVPLDVAWSDIGSWDALYDHSAKDPEQNVLHGDVMTNGTTNCLIRSEGPVVAVSGVSDLIVVATKDAVLILPRHQSQDVRAMAEAAAARGATARDQD